MLEPWVRLSSLVKVASFNKIIFTIYFELELCAAVFKSGRTENITSLILVSNYVQVTWKLAV